jgi:hypothetical protein
MRIRAVSQAHSAHKHSAPCAHSQRAHTARMHMHMRTNSAHIARARVNRRDALAIKVCACMHVQDAACMHRLEGGGAG